MAIPGITYRLELGTSLTHEQMDNNFRSVIYSSSIQDGGDTLRLHFDTFAGDYHQIPLNSGTSGLNIIGNVNNRVVTATGTALQGESNFTFDGTSLNLAGVFSINDGQNNTIIGEGAGGSVIDGFNTTVGRQSGTNLTGISNTALGDNSINNAVASSNSVAVGKDAMSILASGNNNTALGKSAGDTLTSGQGNIYIGYDSGPASNTSESNKLYISNTKTNTPLILGNFATGQLTINSQVSASVFSGSFFGDGSNLTGVTATADWDGQFEGHANITGSLTISGSVVNLIDVQAISGSIFSGSFVGDGSGLTGVQADTFPYTGSAIITGSLITEGPTILSGSSTISGSLTVFGNSNLKGVVIADSNIKIYNPQITSIAIGSGSYLTGGGLSDNVNIGYKAGQNSTGTRHVIVGSCANQNTSTDTVAVGYRALRLNTGGSNIAIGSCALSTFVGSGNNNIAIGRSGLTSITSGFGNIAVGTCSLYEVRAGQYNVGIGFSSFSKLTSPTAVNGNCNTGIGACVGTNLLNGSSNIYIGYKAGPSLPNTTESNKLYINNNTGNPLIGGDFSLKTVTISGSLAVSQSIEAQSFIGDGAQLTNLPQTEWDGTRNGDAEITGSLTVSGSFSVIDLSNTVAISGSIFSGSFVGDGSGLTGVTSEWDGTLDGNGEITGSLIVSGTLSVGSPVTITSGNLLNQPGIELIHFYSSSLAGVHSIKAFEINSSTGYTGFKAEYSLTSADESEKKIGTLLGSWDQSGNTTVNDSHTITTGDVTETGFDIDSDGTTATLRVDADTGTYELNMLITAFKRQV